jgi:hypothetical protein
MKTLLLFLIFGIASTFSAEPPKAEIPKDRLVRLVHYLQVAEVYAKTGAKPDVPANLEKVEKMDVPALKTEAKRLLGVFPPGSVPKDRRPEVLALYVGAVKKLTIGSDADHGEIVKWAEKHPSDWTSEMRKNEQAAKKVIQ